MHAYANTTSVIHVEHHHHVYYIFLQVLSNNTQYTGINYQHVLHENFSFLELLIGTLDISSLSDSPHLLKVKTLSHITE